ncbi:MAG: AraC family transcriptional regulator [Verrucomicrobiota bacterium]
MKAHIEQIYASRQTSFVCRQFNEERFDHPFHYHPEIEVTFITQSAGTRVIGDHLGGFEPGDLCLIGENLPHIYRNTRRTPRGAQSEVLHFSRDCANGFLDIAPEFAEFSQLLDAAKSGLHFDPQTANQAHALLVKIREAKSVRRWTAFLELVELLLSAPKPQTLASAGYSKTVGPHPSDRMRGICQYIIEHFDEELSHQQLAKQAHMSPAYFSRLFKKTTRKSYIEFLTEVRLGHACHLLIETELPIVEIAFHSGFRNLSNFNRRFLAVYDRSPRAYRQQHAAY